MSVPVDLAALRDQVAEHGPLAFLLTVGDGGPHAVSAVPGWDGERIVCAAGRSTSANAAARPSVSLVFPSPVGAAYSLIIDGTAEVGDGVVTITPTRAVLHRNADVADGPNCIPVGE